MTAVILAGGRSERFGTDKAFFTLEGMTIIERQIAVLRELFPDILIVTRNPGKFAHLNVKVVEDLVDEQSPLSGLYTGLTYSQSRFSFVVACDMPFLNKSLISYMQGQCTGEYDAVVPCYGGYLEPLHTFYSVRCRDIVRKQLAAGDFRLTNIYKHTRTRFISEKELLQFGDPKHLFFNINTPQELLKIKRILNKKAFLGNP